jgi:hypothetical protein
MKRSLLAAFGLLFSLGSLAQTQNMGDLNVRSINNIKFADQYPGEDMGAKINNAVSDCRSSYCTVVVPPGHYIYSTDIYFSVPSKLDCLAGAVLDYTGTGKAAKMGPDGLSITSYHVEPYVVEGCEFTGGASMTHGIYFNSFVVNTYVLNVKLRNFGNADAWNIFYQAHNWYNIVDKLWLWSSADMRRPQNGIRTNGVEPNSKIIDFGQSRTLISSSILQPFSPSGIGIYLNAAASSVKDTTISGSWKTAEIQLGAWSSASVLDGVYFEMSGSTLPRIAPMILIGDTSGPYSKQFIDGIQILNSYANLHNSMKSGNGIRFAMPASADARIRNWRIAGLRVADVADGTTLLTLNNLPGQSGIEETSNLYQHNNSAMNFQSLTGRLSNSVFGVSQQTDGDSKSAPGLKVYKANGNMLEKVHVVTGRVQLTAAVPSTSRTEIRGAASFNSASSYECALTNLTDRNHSLQIRYVDGSTFSITGPNGAPDLISYVCIGE